jgi:hypothetical protein
VAPRSQRSACDLVWSSSDPNSKVTASFMPPSPPSTVVRPESPGLGTRALVTAEVDQARLHRALQALPAIPEVIELLGTTG